MKRVLLASAMLLSVQIAKASEKAPVITHPNCQLASAALTDGERAAKGYVPAKYQIMSSLGMIDYTMNDTTDLIGPFKGERVINQENELKASLESLHIAKMPTLKYYDENGKALNLKIKEDFSNPISFAVPEFPLDNAKKIYFEVVVSVDKAKLKNKTNFWAYLTKTPVYEKVIFTSKVFSFSQAAKDLLAKSNHDADEVLSLLAKNDAKEMAEVMNDPAGADTMNFVKMLLVESVRAEGMAETEEDGNLKLLAAIADAIPNCKIQK